MSKLRQYLPGWLEVALFFVLTGLVGVWGFRLEDTVLALIAYTIIVLGLNDTFFSRGIKRGIADIRENPLRLILVVIISALLLIWNFSVEATIFISALFAFLLYEWDSRVFAGAALISLASCVALLMLGDDVGAEQMAIYAYYFLVITVVLQIIEYKRHQERFVEGDAKEASAPPRHSLDLRQKVGDRKTGDMV